MLELSDDGQRWRTAVDHARDGRDAPHDYQVLPRAQRARFVRLRNVQAPDGGNFSLYDLRVFGKGTGRNPGRVSAVQATHSAIYNTLNIQRHQASRNTKLSRFCHGGMKRRVRCRSMNFAPSGRS